MKNEINKVWSEQVASREATASDFVIRSIREYLGKNFNTINRTYSSKGMTETQAVRYLLNETDKLLFPNGERYIYNIIYDTYKEAAGTKAIFEIIRQFVNWVDTEKRF